MNVYLCLQQEVLSELFSYTRPDPSPADVDWWCNRSFEKGLLSHEHVHKKDTSVIQSIEQGYGFFCDWLDGIFKSGKNL